MITYENNCVSCDWCMHCGKDHEPVLICDRCGEEESELYWVEDEQLCRHCVFEVLEEVRPNE